MYISCLFFYLVIFKAKEIRGYQSVLSAYTQPHTARTVAHTHALTSKYLTPTVIHGQAVSSEAARCTTDVNYSNNDHFFFPVCNSDDFDLHTYLSWFKKKKYSKQKEVKENNTRVCRRPLSIFLPREFLLIPVVKQTDSNHTLTFPTITAWRPCACCK